VVPKREPSRWSQRNHPSRDPLRDPAALLTQEGTVPTLTVSDPPGYHFQIMTGRYSNFVYLKQSLAGRVSCFNLPDRSAALHRAE